MSRRSELQQPPQHCCLVRQPPTAAAGSNVRHCGAAPTCAQVQHTTVQANVCRPPIVLQAGGEAATAAASTSGTGDGSNGIGSKVQMIEGMFRVSQGLQAGRRPDLISAGSAGAMCSSMH